MSRGFYGGLFIPMLGSRWPRGLRAPARSLEVPGDHHHPTRAESGRRSRGPGRAPVQRDLRQFTSWCQQRGLHLFDARRADIECYGRDLEAKGRARATVAHRLCTVAGFYRYTVEEDLLDHSPAPHVRRPRLDYESHAVGLDRNEVGALLVAAGLGTASEHALISLLAINGLRVSEALGADIDALGIERGHRTLTILRKGGKIVTIPLAPRTARAIDLAIGERADGPIFLRPDGQRMDRHCAGRIVHRVGRRAGVDKPISPHTLRHAFITADSTPVCRYATCRKPPRTPIPERQCATTTGPGLAGSSRDLHRRRLPGRRRPLNHPGPLIGPQSGRSAGQTVREREIVLDQPG